jgi:hypothetical protein
MPPPSINSRARESESLAKDIRTLAFVSTGTSRQARGTVGAVDTMGTNTGSNEATAPDETATTPIAAAVTTYATRKFYFQKFEFSKTLQQQWQ